MNMIKKITDKSSNKLLKNRVSVLLVFMEGCQACELSKEHYTKFSEVYENISFFEADINKTMSLYVKYADTQEAYQTLLSPDGTPQVDENGNNITELLLDDGGNAILSPKIVAPMFYVFVKEEQSTENEFGHIGGIDGADINSLQAALEALNHSE